MTLMKRLQLGVSTFACLAAIATASAAATPQALSTTDAQRYAAAFEATDRGDFIEAQMQTVDVQDKSLLGYLSFRALMHPTAHKAAFDELAARTGLPVVARFAEGLAIAVERGTPLADVLHAQAADVREAGRRALIEAGARKEVLMMVPVVFLVLPVTVVFAFWPGLVGLQLVTP